MMHTWKKTAVHAAASTLFLGLIACGQINEGTPSSDQKVTNGLSASKEFPSVIMLQFNAGQGTSICTGTFVNDSQVVTAAHCVYDILAARRTASSMSFSKKKSDGTSVRVAATRLEYHPAYTVTPGTLSNHDIAIVTFPRNSAPATTPLYPTEPEVGQTFTIVGYGLNNYSYNSRGEQTGDGSGVKRKGQNQIAVIDNGMIKFYGLPTSTDASTPLGVDSASGSGDSGGPLLINGSLAATTSGGGLASGTDEAGQTFTVKVSNYVDLNEPGNREFLKARLVATPGW